MFLWKSKAYQVSYNNIERHKRIKNPVIFFQIFKKRLQSAPITGVTYF
jgi:hypothetical protein